MLVTIARTEMAPEAHILRGRLEAEGIPAFVQHEHHVTMDWMVSNALGGVRLQVPHEFEQQAVAVLHAIRNGDHQLENSIGTSIECPDGATEAIVPTSKLTEDSNPPCPSCGTPGEMRVTAGRGLVLALLFFYDLPWPWRRAHWRCPACSTNWSTSESQPFRFSAVLALMLVGVLVIGTLMVLIAVLATLLDDRFRFYL